ncbi:MAG: acetoin utilization protein AcuC [Gammaproteobacteria bacterium]
MGNSGSVCVYVGEALGRYGFGNDHPFGPERMGVFWDRMLSQGLDIAVHVHEPVMARREEIERFHTPEYVEKVIRQSESGQGFLDYGDTPAFPGVYEAAAYVVGSAVDGARRLMEKEARHVFIPIAGLHHARRDMAGGFCVFNDCGVVIETLRAEYGLKRVAYVDIDAHHGDGVFYSFEDDPDLLFADLHEDGRYLYPGTGAAEETGRGAAEGTKLNIPLPPGSRDEQFEEAWQKVEQYLNAGRPEFIILQCGADSVRGDPITHMQFSPNAHAQAAARLAAIADQYCEGRLLAVGGGGYNHQNIALAWTGVVRALIEAG